MWTEPRHSLYSSPPRVDDSQTVKNGRGFQVGDPKIQGKSETREQRLYALFADSTFIFAPRIRLAESDHLSTT